MKCSDFIRKMPEALKQQIMGSSHFSAKIKQGYELHELISNPSMLENTFLVMSDLEIEALRTIVSKFGTEPFDWEKLEKSAGWSQSGAGLKAALILLRQKGIVFTLKKSWGESLFLLPFDTFPIWQRLVLGELGLEKCENSTGEIERVEVTHASRGGLLHAMFRLLVYTAKHDVAFTRQGIIHKRHLQKLGEQMELEPESFRSIPLRYAGQPAYASDFAIVHDMAIRLNLLHADTDRLMINMDEIRRFLSQPNERIQAQLLDLWSEVHFPDAAWLRHAAAAIRSIPLNTWASVECVISWLNKHQLLEQSQETKEAQTAFIRQWLEPLAELGWIEIGNSGEKPLFRWLIATSINDKKICNTDFKRVDGNTGRLGSEKGKPEWMPNADCQQSDGSSFVIFVQPDMEVIVPPEVPFDVRWELECLADYIHTDQISRYRITKESIHRACANGRTSQELLRFMKRHARFGLPENVVKTIVDWENQYGKFVFEELVILRCHDERAAELIAADPQYASLVKERLGACFFALERDRVEPFMKALQQSGYVPQRHKSLDEGQGRLMFPKWNQDERFPLPFEDSAKNNSYSDQMNVSENEGCSLSRGIVYPHVSVHYFELDPRLPDMADIYPNLHGIPAMWLRDCRAYHSSTKKEMIEKAMEWRASLRISREGLETTFIPKSLRQTTEGWHVIGIGRDDEMIFFPDEWQQVQLILPGINDHRKKNDI